MDLNDSKEINFEFPYIFSRNWILEYLWTYYSPESIRVNSEVLKLLHFFAWIAMKFTLNNKEKGLPLFSGDKFLNFILFLQEIAC